MVEDRTNITLIIIIQFVLKVIQLIIYLLCGSYFLGMLWLIMCKYTSRWGGQQEDDNFLDAFGLKDLSEYKLTVTLLYFAFTSLSTVGLGDLHPRSSIERLVGALVLLFGVALTSFIMETLSLMIVKIQKLNKDFEQRTELSQFFKTMERFN